MFALRDAGSFSADQRFPESSGADVSRGDAANRRQFPLEIG